jgi:hypothetical protein
MDSNGCVVLASNIKVTPNSSEKIVLNIIRQRGPVVTFQELSEEFTQKKRSLQSLALTLRYSVLFHRVEPGLYALRGARITREGVDAALARRPEIEHNGSIHFSPGGIVTWEINVGTYGIGGTIPAGEAARLAGEWNTVVENTDTGRIKVGDRRIWGLAKAFHELDVKVGDRVALHFNPQARQVQVVKLRKMKDEP